MTMAGPQANTSPPPVVVVAAIILMVTALVTTTSNAMNYMVGDSSGWDISTDLDTWTAGKTFYVGDALLFQYSSSYSVEEVTKDSFDNCSTTNYLKTYSSANGNTTIPLTRPGGWYFVPGNRLYCLGGMKLQVNVQDGTGGLPAGAPQGAEEPGAPGALPRPSTKSNDPSAPTSNAGENFGVLVSSIVGLVSSVSVPHIILAMV